MAIILVSLDLRENLYQLMNICKENEWLVDLEYEGIPFQGNRCHINGLLSSFCTLPFNTKHNQSFVHKYFDPTPFLEKI